MPQARRNPLDRPLSLTDPIDAQPLFIGATKELASVTTLPPRPSARGGFAILLQGTIVA